MSNAIPMHAHSRKGPRASHTYVAFLAPAPVCGCAVAHAHTHTPQKQRTAWADTQTHSTNNNKKENKIENNTNIVWSQMVWGRTAALIHTTTCIPILNNNNNNTSITTITTTNHKHHHNNRNSATNQTWINKERWGYQCTRTRLELRGCGFVCVEEAVWRCRRAPAKHRIFSEQNNNTQHQQNDTTTSNTSNTIKQFRLNSSFFSFSVSFPFPCWSIRKQCVVFFFFNFPLFYPRTSW